MGELIARSTINSENYPLAYLAPSFPRNRVFQGGTDAVTRVLIELTDASGARWSTVGVSANIIDASFQALLDAINYKLMKAGV